MDKEEILKDELILYISLYGTQDARTLEKSHELDLFLNENFRFNYVYDYAV